MRHLTIVVSLLLTAAVLAGCSDDAAAELTPAERLSAAQQVIDDAASFNVDLNATELPSDVSGLKSAVGVADRSPAFKGEVEVITGGSTLGASITAVDDVVWAKTGFSPVFVQLDPADLNAPDPADLAVADGGVPELLTQATDLSDEGSERDGRVVVSSISGKLSGDILAALLPTASAVEPFDVVFRLTEDNELHDMRISGLFYGDKTATYTIKLSPRSNPAEITAP